MWRYRNAAHYLAGIEVALAWRLHWTLPLVGALFFLIYELDEDWHIKDKAFHDILEAMLGFYAAVGAQLLWRWQPWMA